MKKIVIIAFLLVLSGFGAFAQRFAYVDSEYILKHIPEYNSSQKQLDALSAQWQKDVDAKFAAIEGLFKAYQADQVLLTEEMKKNRENEIIEKEKEAKEFQRVKFGFEGELFQVRTKLIKPIQERVSKAIQAVADAQQLDMIFDKNSEITLLYASPRLDKSNDVIIRLGYKPGTLTK
ncbi:OmpH family outer membrane protein [Daejeonella sp. H1SJ63]|uniref:OmpH family outer membrane protein n=1 Tax=Daejeonella sp. H1SJ63 TaxID=3034145 RepID=UPI0023EC850E|nr:OmpH family outer membrane protein [Daejeonella sp. H1SJ63]